MAWGGHTRYAAVAFGGEAGGGGCWRQVVCRFVVWVVLGAVGCWVVVCGSVCCGAVRCQLVVVSRVPVCRWEQMLAQAVWCRVVVCV